MARSIRSIVICLLLSCPAWALPKAAVHYIRVTATTAIAQSSTWQVLSVQADCAANCTITLPSVQRAGQTVFLWGASTGAAVATLAASGGDTIAGVTTVQPGDVAIMRSNTTTNWQGAGYMASTVLRLGAAGGSLGFLGTAPVSRPALAYTAGGPVASRTIAAATAVTLADLSGGAAGAIALQTLPTARTDASGGAAGNYVAQTLPTARTGDGGGTPGNHVAQTLQTTQVDNTGGVAGATYGAVTDPGDAPATADVLRDDLVANTIPPIRNAVASTAARLAEVRAQLVVVRDSVATLATDAAAERAQLSILRDATTTNATDLAAVRTQLSVLRDSVATLTQRVNELIADLSGATGVKANVRQVVTDLGDAAGYGLLND